MAITVHVDIKITDIATQLLTYDTIRVYRSPTETGSYTLIGTVALVAAQESYSYQDDTAPYENYWYRWTTYNAVGPAESAASASIQGLHDGDYISLQNIRDEGITESDLSDERAIALIHGWQAWFEQMTGQFFVEKTATVDFDGDGSRLLQLPMPIITCTSLYINDDFTNVVATTSYSVYNQRGPVVDDRKNPRIKLKWSTQASSIYTSSSYGRFQVGELNQRVVGTWGYTESDGSTPLAVQRAVLILVTATAELLSDGEIDQLKFGKVIEEVTDRHRIEYADLWNRLKTWAPTGITEVDMALAAYRRPLRITAPRNIGLLYPSV